MRNQYILSFVVFDMTSANEKNKTHSEVYIFSNNFVISGSYILVEYEKEIN